jgi:hypothetical protein
LSSPVAAWRLFAVRIGATAVTIAVMSLALAAQKFADSPLEGDGFELLVPRRKSRGFPQHSGHLGVSALPRRRKQIGTSPNAAVTTAEDRLVVRD